MAALKTGDDEVAAVEDQLGALFDALVDPALDGLPVGSAETTGPSSVLGS